MTCEADIITSILGGDIQKYELFVEKYQKLVYSVSYGVVKNEQSALDITQESFIKAYDCIKTSSITNFKSFICRVAMNKSIDFMRKKQNQSALHQDINDTAFTVSSGELTEDDYIKKEQNLLLRKQVSTLPDKYKEVITRYYFEEKPCAQIASETGLNVKTVETRLIRARKILKSTLERGG